ncbi:sigma 54-interacting transcriptional regulator [Acinetobacter sp. ANC 5584]
MDRDLLGIQEVASRLGFSFKTGQIWLDEERMMLMHSSAMATLRKELIDSVGFDRARGIFTRFGYASGVRDAEIVRKTYKNLSDLELLEKGPLFHSLEGIVKVTFNQVKIDIQKGQYFLDGTWENSIESYIHHNLYGVNEDPVCWTEVGHATGYVSAIMGKFILHKEISCSRASCNFIGKPIEEWDDFENDLKYYQTDSIFEQLLSLQHQVDDLRASLTERLVPADMVGKSVCFRQTWQLAEKAAQTSTTVLLLGETGAGKDVFARAIHQASPRADKAFVAVNCGALPNDLIESELFGIEKGAYTGAQSSRAGRFERADGGTLFLDEVGELSLSAQTRLLRALQSGEIDRLGDTTTRKVNVRVIAATNVDLAEAVEKGTFRKDLYYRLNIFPVFIPPLRERKEDILILAQRFVEKFTAREGKRIKGFTDKAIDMMLNYNWPGNVRELENVIERGMILTGQDELIDASTLFSFSLSFPDQEKNRVLNTIGKVENKSNSQAVDSFIDHFFNESITLEDVESILVDAAIKRSEGNLCAAARTLGITRAQIGYKKKKLMDIQ